MYQPLIPCPGCARHVRAAEAACPFCDAALPTNVSRRATPAAPQRLSRAAAFVFGATFAAAGCGDGSVMPLYGAPAPTDAAADAVDGASDVALYGAPDVGPAPADASDDDGGLIAMYGGPPPTDAGGCVVDDGGNAALYGDPPAPCDAGSPDDDGGNAALYGIAPPPRDT